MNNMEPNNCQSPRAHRSLQGWTSQTSSGLKGSRSQGVNNMELSGHHQKLNKSNECACTHLPCMIKASGGLQGKAKASRGLHFHSPPLAHTDTSWGIGNATCAATGIVTDVRHATSGIAHNHGGMAILFVVSVATTTTLGGHNVQSTIAKLRRFGH